MTCEYDSTSQYINNFDINAPIVDTEERDKMCELWGELAYSKIYLLSLCYDEEQKMEYWYKEEVYWTGWEWNEENNHIHGIGTMRNMHDEDEQQKNHMVWDRSFGLILSKKRLKEICDKNKETTDKREKELNKCINNIFKYRRWGDKYMKYAYSLNKGNIPGMLKIKFPKIRNDTY